MRIKFSILWFDDSSDYFDSLDLEQLRGEIRSWGFSPNIVQVTTPVDFNKYKPFAEFDLIVVDQHLEEYPDGQEFIADLRSNAVYTEVIFYTAGEASALWAAISEIKLEGVFVSTRNTIMDKISSVGRQSIRKILDLDNMRGIVMAEVGELDHLLDKILTVGMGNLSPEQQRSIFNAFHKKSIEQHDVDVARLSKFGEDPQLVEMLALCDSNKRWENYNRLKKKHDRLKGEDKIGDFVQEILRPRNFLAHGTSEVRPDGSYLFHFGKQEFLFDESTGIELRQTILKYRNSFSEILTLLTQVASAN